ncbi:uncharacterized protein LOC114522374 [Dendronephthya gigantea]|uniref:uncharacterized protein LOC114522374 n=1 Tax=Dendronephthya gigantea TaxID=151771 RepID=UPI00106C2064|nr:uncharacterized protein LOC114522374 [Dendronephthya gigantea]
MSNPNASEPEVAVKVDERLSTLSSIARNVTLRLTNQTSTKKGNVPKIVSKNTATNVNRKEPLGNRKKEVLNIKVLSNGDDDLREKNVDLKQIIEEKVVNKNECPESPTQFKEDKFDLASSKMTKIKTSQFVELKQ